VGVLGCSGKRSSVVTDKGGHRGGCWLLGPVLSDVSRWETLDERRNKTNLRPGCPIGYQRCTPLVSQRSREQTGQGGAGQGPAWHGMAMATQRGRPAQEIRPWTLDREPARANRVAQHDEVRQGKVIISCRRSRSQDASTRKRLQRSIKLQLALWLPMG
jgi:hypothetical protein